MADAEKDEIAALRAEVARLAAAQANPPRRRVSLAYLLAAAGAMLLFGAAYLASPFYALHQPQEAARSGDRDRLEQLVDFPKVRENLKAAVSAYVLKSVRTDPQMANNPFAALGALIVPAIADRAIDAYVTADGVAAMVNSGNPPKLYADNGAPQASQPPANLTFSPSYVDLDHFRVKLARADNPENAISMILERHGLFGWKLTSISFNFPAAQPQPSAPPTDAEAPLPPAAANDAGAAEPQTNAPEAYSPPPPPPDVTAQLSPQDAVVFSRYAVDVYTGPTVSPDFTGRDRWARMYRTMIMDGLHDGTVFAGHLAVAVFGCGTDCLSGYVIDVRSGQVFLLPVGGENQPDLDLQFVKDSDLLRTKWNSVQADPSSSCVYQDFVWTDHGFVSGGQRNDNHPCPRSG